MDINHFEPCDSIVPHHILMLGARYQTPMVVYSGPLKGVTEQAMAIATMSLVHPGTLAAIKAKLDSLGDAGAPAERPPPAAAEGVANRTCSDGDAHVLGSFGLCVFCGTPMY